MNANELRVGNYYKLKTEKTIFDVSCIEVLISSQIDGFDINHIEPIPLTEDFLLKFGFYILHETEKTKIYWKGEKQRINVNNNLFYYKVYNGSKQIKYVHELQNLYFALTGKELTPTL